MKAVSALFAEDSSVGQVFSNGSIRLMPPPTAILGTSKQRHKLVIKTIAGTTNRPDKVPISKIRLN
jgi:hypothetical protein